MFDCGGIVNFGRVIQEANRASCQARLERRTHAGAGLLQTALLRLTAWGITKVAVLASEFQGLNVIARIEFTSRIEGAKLLAKFG